MLTYGIYETPRREGKRTIYMEGSFPDGSHEYSLWSMLLLSQKQADELLAAFIKPAFPLVADPVVIVYGKKCHSHRRVAFFSDVAHGYPFAGQVAESLPLSTHPWLNKSMEIVNKELNTCFNGILINHYRDGTDSIGSHADDESTLSDGVVACINFGASRKFRIRDKYGELLLDIATGHGNLLVMDGAFQKLFKHEIPTEKRIKAPRVSLTYRVHVEM